MCRVPLNGNYWFARYRLGHYQDNTGTYALYCWQFRDQELRNLIHDLGGRVESPELPYDMAKEVVGYAVFPDDATAVTFKLEHL